MWDGVGRSGSLDNHHAKGVTMHIWIDRDVSSEYSATDLFEDWRKYMVEAEVTDAEWLEDNKVVEAYWKLQDKYERLFEAGKSTQGDKR